MRTKLIINTNKYKVNALSQTMHKNKMKNYETQHHVVRFPNSWTSPQNLKITPPMHRDSRQVKQNRKQDKWAMNTNKTRTNNVKQMKIAHPVSRYSRHTQKDKPWKHTLKNIQNGKHEKWKAQNRTSDRRHESISKSNNDINTQCQKWHNQTKTCKNKDI